MPDLNDVVYGRAVQHGGRLWLQYWFWYFARDDHLGIECARHEGGWQMVQFRLNGEQPDVAVYAQDSVSEKRLWEEVEKDPWNADTPLIYVARGSHASYFEAGFHVAGSQSEYADGKRLAKDLTLKVVDEDHDGWLGWPRALGWDADASRDTGGGQPAWTGNVTNVAKPRPPAR